MIRIGLLLLGLGLSACSSHTMAECKGPILAMNTGQWQPTPQDVEAAKALCPK